MDNDTIKMNMCNTFSLRFTELIDNEIQQQRKEGNLFFEHNIYEKMRISKVAFKNYKNGMDSNGNLKFPDAVAINKIKNYYNVPYSYLLGETNTKDYKNLSVGIKCGLDDESINKLLEYKKFADDRENENSYKFVFKLFLINSIIKNDDFLESLFNYLSIALGRNELNKKYSSNLHYQKFNLDDNAFGYAKFKIIEDWLKYINKIVDGVDVPLDVKKYSFDYAKKYSGSMQEVIRKIDNGEV